MCGKGVDQTTRSPQIWQVFAPELQEYHAIDNNMGWEFGGGFFTDALNSFDVWGALARPVFPIVQLKKIDTGKDYPSRMSLGMFDILSNKLIDMVVKNVALLEDNNLIALGLTCQGFWELIVRRIRIKYVRGSAPWTGQRIAFQGSYSTTVPPSLEENDFALKMVNSVDCYLGQHLGRSLFCFLIYEGTALETTQTIEANLLKVVEEQLPNSKIPEWRWSALKEALKRQVLFPMDREWVLRNLTTKEYVSESFTVATKHLPGLRLVDALLTQICWTNMPPRQIGNDSDPNVFEGEWAGHRFDIMTKNALMRDEGFEEWKDVTDAVVRNADLFRPDL